MKLILAIFKLNFYKTYLNFLSKFKQAFIINILKYSLIIFTSKNID